MTDDASRLRIGAAMERTRLEKALTRRHEVFGKSPMGDLPDDPLYRKPDQITPTPTVRQSPDTVGDSEWSKVSDPLRKAIASAISDQRWPIYLYGPVGTGKSCAAACVYQRWPGFPLWHECARIMADVIECRTNKTGLITRQRNGLSYEEGQQTILTRIEQADLFVLNELGLRKPSDAVYEVLIGIIDSRLNKPTIVTSNLEPEQLAKVFDDRVASRLLRGAVIHAVGDDRRSENFKFVRAKGSTV